VAHIIVIVIVIIALGFAVDVWRNSAGRRTGSRAARPRERALQSPTMPQPAQARAAARGVPQTESRTISLLACTALLMLVFPMLSLHVPERGDQKIAGYAVVSKVDQFSHQVNALQNAPLSVRAARLVAVFITGAFVCAMLTLLGALVNLRAAQLFSTAGALLGLAAIVHVRLIDGDLQRMLQQSLDRQAQNPFGVAFGLGNLMANAFRMRPGAGLYVLMIALGVAAVIVRSRFLHGVRLAEPA
jgi:hypothetical protein